MKRYSKIKKGITVLLGSVMAAGMMLGTGNVMQAQAEETAVASGKVDKDVDGSDDKCNSYYGISNIKEIDSKSSILDYVYFGTKDNKPIKFRVLDKSSSFLSEYSNSLLLDCDEILENANYSSSIGSKLSVRDLVLKNLFYTKYLSDTEKEAISRYTYTSDGKTWEFPNVDLFYKDFSEDGEYTRYPVGIDNYYVTDDVRKKTTSDGTSGSYWLVDGYYVDENGKISTEQDGTGLKGVSPIVGLDVDRILFNTVLPKDEDSNTTYHERKLTLIADEEDLKLETSMAKDTGTEYPVIQSSSKNTSIVTVPYKVTGKYKNDVTIAVYVTKTDSAGINLSYYKKADISEDGETVSFEWNTVLDDMFFAGNNYHLYLVAEKRTDGYGTDLASEPVELAVPHKEINQITLQFSEPFSGEEKYNRALENSETAKALSKISVNSFTFFVGVDKYSSNVTRIFPTDNMITSVVEKDSESQGTEPAKFNTSYQASLKLTINNESNYTTTDFAFADTVSITVLDAKGNKLVENKKVSIKDSDNSTNTSLVCDNLFEFTTRKAKLVDIISPTTNDQNVFAEINYAHNYEKVLEQLNQLPAEKKKATILVEGHDSSSQDYQEAVIKWSGSDYTYKTGQNGGEFTAGYTLENIEGADSDHEYDFVGHVDYARISMKEKQTVGTPTADPTPNESSTYDGPSVTVKLSPASGWEDSTIYYTLDGTDPTTSSNRYDSEEGEKEENGIVINAPMEDNQDAVVLKAIAVRGDDTPSEVATWTYTFKSKQTLNVVDGTIEGASGDDISASFRPGETVTVKADDKTSQGLIFEKWTVSNDVTLISPDSGEQVDLTSKEITFKMPDVTNGLTLTATYEKVGDPEIETHPSNASVSDGESATFEIKVAYDTQVYKDSDFTYQWMQKSTGDSDFANIENATSSTYTIEKATYDMNGTQYRCIVTYTPKGSSDSEEDSGSEGETSTEMQLTSNAATLTVTKSGTGFQITSPTNQTAQVGDSATFKVSVQKAYDTDTLTYQWYSGEKDSGTEIENATSDSCTIDDVTEEMDGIKYYCVVKEYSGEELVAAGTSDAATLTIGTTPDPEPEPEPETYTVTVTGGTADASSYKEGDTVTITASVPDKQKFVKWAGNVSFADAESSTTTFTMPANNVAVTANFESDYAINITKQPENVSVPAGGSATFTIVAESSYDMTYEWKADYNDGRGFQTVGAGSSYDVTNAVASLNGARYECIITIDNKAYSVTSSVAVLTVEAAEYTIKVNNGTASVASSKAGETITIKANAASSGQQFKKWTIVSGRVNFGDATKEETTFTMPAADVEVTAEYQNQLTTPVITTNPESVTIYAGSGTSFKVAASGEELSYQWKVDKTDGNGYQDISGATSATYRVYTEDASMNGYKYKCVVSNRSGSAESKEAVLTVDYKITEGARSTFNKSGSTGLTFKGSGAYNKFRYVQVDGSRISGSNFTKKSDPTIITLNASYLKGLSNGEHTLVIVWEDGKATTTFTVAGTDTGSSSSSGSTSSGSSSSSASKSSSSSKKTTTAATESSTDTAGETEAEEETVDMPVVSRAESADESDEKTQEKTTVKDTEEKTYGANDSVISSADGSIEKKKSWLNRYAAACSIVVIILSALGIGLVLMSRKRNK